MQRTSRFDGEEILQRYNLGHDEEEGVGSMRWYRGGLM